MLFQPIGIMIDGIITAKAEKLSVSNSIKISKTKIETSKQTTLFILLQLLNPLNMFGESLTIGNDILDIGSQKYDNQSDQRAIGSGAMIPKLALGEPGQFEVPNVADVSVVYL
jgi:hypothetical protein